jgi:hypothetical protein
MAGDLGQKEAVNGIKYRQRSSGSQANVVQQRLRPIMLMIGMETVSTQIQGQ